VSIVQGKPREPEGIVTVTKASREEALATAKEFFDQFPFVTIVADGRVYTVEEFAKSINEADGGPKVRNAPPI
jgi:hypothetical protein